MLVSIILNLFAYTVPYISVTNISVMHKHLSISAFIYWRNMHCCHAWASKHFCPSSVSSTFFWNFAFFNLYFYAKKFLHFFCIVCLNNSTSIHFYVHAFLKCWCISSKRQISASITASNISVNYEHHILLFFAPNISISFSVQYHAFTNLCSYFVIFLHHLIFSQLSLFRLSYLFKTFPNFMSASSAWVNFTAFLHFVVSTCSSFMF